MKGGESLAKFKSLQITQLDDDDDDEVNEPSAAQINGGDDLIDDEEEEYDEDEEEEEVPVTLGFVEKPKNKYSLLRHFFPSKAGSSPAWLDPVNLPCGSSRECDFCSEPLQFLLQVYAPLSGKESTFHRTLYVFMCTSMTCLLRDQHEQWKRQPPKTRSVKVFRCQLPCVNIFYSSTPPKHDGTDKPLTVGAALCTWCGTWKGEQVCGGCKRTRYCSKKHQSLHWKLGHKNECRLSDPDQSLNDKSPTGCSTEIGKAASNTKWPEFEIIHDDEGDCDRSVVDTDDNSLVSVSRTDEALNSLEDTFQGDSDNKSLAIFLERIGRDPEQVLRYSRNERAKPLWPMSSGRPSRADIPKCSYCGGPREFEFQVLPQLLYYFGVKDEVGSLDWSSIIVYTCKSSCEEGVESYKEEFAWVQLISESATKA